MATQHLPKITGRKGFENVILYQEDPAPHVIAECLKRGATSLRPTTLTHYAYLYLTLLASMTNWTPNASFSL